MQGHYSSSQNQDLPGPSGIHFPVPPIPMPDFSDVLNPEIEVSFYMKIWYIPLPRGLLTIPLPARAKLIPEPLLALRIRGDKVKNPWKLSLPT